MIDFRGSTQCIANAHCWVVSRSFGFPYGFYFVKNYSKTK